MTPRDPLNNPSLHQFIGNFTSTPLADWASRLARCLARQHLHLTALLCGDARGNSWARGIG